MLEDRRVERGAAQGEVVEGDVEEGDVAALGPLERLRRALGDGAAEFDRIREGEAPAEPVFVGC